MSGYVVVDASLAVKWLVEEDDPDKAHAVLESWVARDVTRIAPYLMAFEVANALHRRVLRGELNVGDSTRMSARVQESRLELQQPPGRHRLGPLHETTLELLRVQTGEHIPEGVVRGNAVGQV